MKNIKNYRSWSINKVTYVSICSSVYANLCIYFEILRKSVFVVYLCFGVECNLKSKLIRTLRATDKKNGVNLHNPLLGSSDAFLSLNVGIKLQSYWRSLTDCFNFNFKIVLLIWWRNCEPIKGYKPKSISKLIYATKLTNNNPIQQNICIFCI